jgi:hypothetical protein
MHPCKRIQSPLRKQDVDRCTRVLASQHSFSQLCHGWGIVNYEDLLKHERGAKFGVREPRDPRRLTHWVKATPTTDRGFWGG